MLIDKEKGGWPAAGSVDIAEAVTRPTMRFVAIRSTDQVDLQALHRMRSQLVSSRTRLINQMRAFCLEYGIAMRQGAGVFKLDIHRVLGDECNDLTTTMRRLLTDMVGDLEHLERRIKAVTDEIDAVAAKDDAARRLMTIPGIGTLGATALLSAIGDAGNLISSGLAITMSALAWRNLVKTVASATR